MTTPPLEDLISQSLGSDFKPDSYDYSLVFNSGVPRRLQQGYSKCGECTGSVGEKFIIMRRAKEFPNDSRTA